MENVIQWFAVHENAIAILVTIGVAVFLVCCLACSSCPSRDKDDIFRHRAL